MDVETTGKDVDPKTTELGHTFSLQELRNHCKAVWGCVSFPGKRPGFAVVIGMGHKPHFDSHDFYLLDEYESFDMRKLIRMSGALDLKYGISLSDYSGESGQWVGDLKNDAADRFLNEMNAERSQQFSLSPTLISEMENPYSFILPKIKELLEPERRQLFLKDSKVVQYLREIEGSEIAELKLGDFPAIEALAFTVMEISQWEQSVRMQGPYKSPWGGNCLTRGLRSFDRRRRT